MIEINGARIVDINAHNIDQYPEVVCFINKKNEFHHIKVDWLKQRFTEGLKIKLLIPDGEKKAAGFIEYVPGENAWRGVDAPGYMFVHCIWVSPNKFRGRGYGSALAGECISEAREMGMSGVAVVSGGSFMAENDLFLKNGFVSEAKTKSGHELLSLKFGKSEPPVLRDVEKQLQKYNGLHIVYSDQCPWVSRFMRESKEIIDQYGIKIEIHKIKTSEDAQNTPSVYSAFNLVHNGKILADHYISCTRFKNILNKLR
jgi:ribosomal protein S18 acetylase RimI-like enzyme